MLLLAGGALDPHNLRVLAAAQARGTPVRALWVGPEHHPRLHLTLPDAALWLDGEPLAPTALWLRHDIFHALADPRPAVQHRAAAWYEALASWALLHPEVRVYNRGALRTRPNKLWNLHRAAACGLRVAPTVVSNDLGRLRAEGTAGRVAKPLLGGSWTLPLAEALDQAPAVGDAAIAPAFAQAELHYPELRVQLVGPRAFAWEITASTLDHRAEPQAPAREVPPPPALLGPLRALAAELGLDLCAADFKQDPQGWVFLEINTQPMWTAFDTICGGALVEALLDGLLGPPAT